MKNDDSTTLHSEASEPFQSGNLIPLVVYTISNYS